MRKLLIAACFASAGCARGGGGADSARAAPADSTIVPGPPAVPSTQTAPNSTAAPTPKTSPPASARGSTSASTTPAPGADSVGGIVSVVGTSFEKRVMVGPAGRQRIEVVGSIANLIGHVAGAEVMVFGRLSGARLDATRFVVRSVDGQPAIDGILKTEAGALYIVTPGGTRTRIMSPPPPLVGQDGARVWITGDPARAVSSFGFIDPPR